MIDLEQARGLLARAVLTQGPDFVYNVRLGAGCHYEPQSLANIAKADGNGYNFEPKADDPRAKTGCLIGVALSLAGETWHLGGRTRIADMNQRYPGHLTEAAVDYFARAQQVQDSCGSWGEAYRTAEAIAENLAKFYGSSRN